MGRYERGASMGSIVAHAVHICGSDKVGLPPHRRKGGRLFVIFGERQLAVLDLTDWLTRRPCSERRFPRAYLSKAVNFYPVTRADGLVRGGFTSLSNHVTKSDDEPGGCGHVWQGGPGKMAGRRHANQGGEGRVGRPPARTCGGVAQRRINWATQRS
jgi:hypothetical protein